MTDILTYIAIAFGLLLFFGPKLVDFLKNASVKEVKRFVGIKGDILSIQKTEEKAIAGIKKIVSNRVAKMLTRA